MATDDLVTAAIAHWAPRFVANGVPLTDFQEVTASVASWDDWCARWSERAAEHEEIGREALSEGRLRSAADHLTTAGVCYHFGKFLFVDHPDQMRDAHLRAVACRTDALPHLEHPGERVEIPFEGSRMVGNLRRPRGSSRPPVVVMVMGLDSAKEEMHAYEELFLARGLATFAFDGPGQGEAEYDLPIRGDYEVAVSAVYDHLQGRDDVDGDRIGLWGVSLGGYYAPRAAAFEPRVRACVALAGPYDWAEAWPGLPALTRRAFMARSRVTTEEAAIEHGRTLSLKGVAGNITCPLFIVMGRQDRIIPPASAERLAAEASGEVRLLMIENGNHVANNRAHRYRNQTADWMAAKLA